MYILAAICTLAGAAVARTSARIVTRPVTSLIQAARKIQKGDLTPRVKVNGDDEISVLQKTFNSMMDRIQETIEEREMACRVLDKYAQAVEEKAIRDEMTGLYNYRYFYTRLDEEIERSQRMKTPLSVLILDLDNFKEVNDRYGHVAGDYLLREMTTRLQGLLRSADILARYGGDECAIILPDTSLEEAQVIAGRIQKAFASEPLTVQDFDPIRITLSIGAAQYEEKFTPEDFIHTADQALYEAKKAGGNQARFAAAAAK